MKEQDGAVGRDKTLGAGRLELLSWPCLQGFSPPCLSFTIWKKGLMVQTSSVKQTSKQRTSLSFPGENMDTQREFYYYQHYQLGSTVVQILQ